MKDESGFTLIETLCAVALILIIAGAAGSLIFSSRRITDSVKVRSQQQFRQLRIERLVRETIEGVSIPFWEREEQALPLAREAVSLALSQAGFNYNFSTETLLDRTGRIRGIRCFFLIDGIEYEASGLFASVPLERGL